MSRIKRLIHILFVIMLSILILVISIEYNTFSLSSYKASFEKYDLGLETNKTKEEFLDISGKLIEYMKSNIGDEELGMFFNNKELLHMKDVQEIFRVLRIIKYVGSIYVLTVIIYTYTAEDIYGLLRTTYRGLFFNFIFLGLVLVMVIKNFGKYFEYFHLILFDNDLWLLNPETDLLIQMMPESFFVDMALKIGFTYIFMVILVQIISYVFIKTKMME